MADFNKNELILDRVRSLTAHELGNGKMMFRLTSIEDPSLQCTAEGEEITDAIGATITTLYRAKKAKFSGSNSLISLDLAAAQFGAKKEVGSSSNQIIDWTYDILTIPEKSATVELSKTPANGNEIRYIYSITNNEIGTAYEVTSSTVDATHFSISGNTITVPTGLKGKIFVEYAYKAVNAVKISNRSTKFPEACSMIIYAYFKDKCNENIVYSGKVICPKAKLNPEQIELALTSSGKHPFEFIMMKDYCADEGADELFSIIVAE